MIRPPPRSTLFPNTTLSRSAVLPLLGLAVQGARGGRDGEVGDRRTRGREAQLGVAGQDRKSTRLNSSHANISYAVFCLKKKKTTYHVYTAIERSDYSVSHSS